jgi:hypothetical protein
MDMGGRYSAKALLIWVSFCLAVIGAGEEESGLIKRLLVQWVWTKLDTLKSNSIKVITGNG